jgi:hypothetical protein
VYILENTSPPPSREGISADIRWGKKMEKGEEKTRDSQTKLFLNHRHQISVRYPIHFSILKKVLGLKHFYVNMISRTTLERYFLTILAVFTTTGSVSRLGGKFFPLEIQ